MTSKGTNHSVLIHKKNSKKKNSINLLCTIMRPHFIRTAELIGIMFAFGLKRIYMPLLCIRGTHQKWKYFVPPPRPYSWAVFFFLGKYDGRYLYADELVNCRAYCK